MSFSLGLPPHTCTCTRARWCTRILYLPLFSLNKAWLSLPMRETAERLSCWLRWSLFWGTVFQFTFKGFSCLPLRRLLFVEVLLTHCVSVRALYCHRACDVSELWAFWGFHSSSALLSEREWEAKSQTAPSFFFSFFFFFLFFKPRRNVSHERDWLKWLQSNPRKVRFHNFTKAMLREEIHWIQNVFTINHRNRMLYTFKLRLYSIWVHLQLCHNWH